MSVRQHSKQILLTYKWLGAYIALAFPLYPKHRSSCMISHLNNDNSPEQVVQLARLRRMTRCD